MNEQDLMSFIESQLTINRNVLDSVKILGDRVDKIEAIVTPTTEPEYTEMVVSAQAEMNQAAHYHDGIFGLIDNMLTQKK